MVPLPLQVSEDEVEITAMRAQGAGGQNVNKVSSAVHLRFDVVASSLPEGVKERLLALRDTRITQDGVVVIKAQQYRSQEQNRADALERLNALVNSVAVPPRVRRATKPTYGSKQRRLQSKTQRGETKALRGRGLEGVACWLGITGYQSYIHVPALFVSHGAPLFALDAGTTGPALTQWGQSLKSQYPGLRGVVVMSPHWMARSAQVMTGPQPATWHDFGGFPPALYQLQYPAPGSPALAQEVLGLLQAAGVAAQGDAARPFDHGAWVPLMHLFPQADVPVVQVALPVGAGPADVYALGAALRSLRSQGVLVVGSGSMTHNLAEFFGGERAPAPYVLEFSRWIEDALARGDMAALLNYRSQAPHAHRAHPTEDHFLPIFFALGAAGDDLHANYLSREVMYSMLSMDAFALEPVH
eukprot:gene4899-4941_t